jgi:hypothetical protein
MLLLPVRAVARDRPLQARGQNRQARAPRRQRLASLDEAES